ncbi:MAG: hypothetical protein CUN56_00660 [Phototrophicales bacterium]|nr:MAG: hypothetical protein CUN56_00660 [Phototrophicales bacterium]
MIYKNKTGANNGFTLIEMLVALSIAIIMGASIGAPFIATQIEKAKAAAFMKDIEKLQKALSEYRDDTNTLPGDGGLKNLIDNLDKVAGWQGPYLMENELTPDPYGEEYGWEKKLVKDDQECRHSEWHQNRTIGYITMVIDDEKVAKRLKLALERSSSENINWHGGLLCRSTKKTNLYKFVAIMLK